MYVLVHEIIADDVKIKLSEVSLHGAAQQTSVEQKRYELPDGRVLSIGNARML